MNPKLDRLQEITGRLRSGRPFTRRTLERTNGEISGSTEEHFPFDPQALVNEAVQLNADLNAARLVGDESIIHAAAMVYFLEAAEKYAGPESVTRLHRSRDEIRKQLDAIGVQL